VGNHAGCSRCGRRTRPGSTPRHRHRLRRNPVVPGPTESEALVAARLSEVVISAIEREEAARIPLCRGDPAEVARWILHLADPAGSWVTGQVIAVDGGVAVA
jgi:NAD(P)-dependent dehydrogenase (short-subunit alcohol dehydrogenase family)